ncbi:MAG: MoxR family ATPase [Thermofilaceae archaeon]
MKPSQLVKALEYCVETKVPMFIWGPPGIGKSSIVRQFAHARGMQLIDIRLLHFDTVDLRGVPFIQGGKTCWAAPSFFPSDGQGILFLDELNSASPQVQAAAYQLVLDRRLGEYVLPPDWLVIGAGNNEGEGVVFRMPPPLANRFVHVDLEPDVDDWTEWALKANLAFEVIAFIRFRPELLFKFSAKEKAFPTPRSWERVSMLLPLIKQPEGLEVVQGIVGKGPGAEFYGFLKVFSELPSFEEILLDPENAPVPVESSARYAVSALIAQKTTPDVFDRVLTYLYRLPEEYCVFAVKAALCRNPSIAKTRAFCDFAVRHKHLILPELS